MAETFEDIIPFSEQREYLSAWQPLRHYLLDWLIAIYYDLTGKTSPYEYAARVGMGRKLLTNLNDAYQVATQKTLVKIVRNLFPYDQVEGGLPSSIEGLIEGEHGAQSELRRQDFLPLLDRAIREPTLVQERYAVLGEAFSRFAIGETEEIKYRLQEEVLEPHMDLAHSRMKALEPAIEALAEARNIYYDDFPPEELRSVSNHTIAMRVELHVSRNIPKNVEPDTLRKDIEKGEEVIRKELNVIMLRAKEMEEGIRRRMERYLDDLSGIMTMAAAIQTYVDAERFQEIDMSARELESYIHAFFDKRQYLPSDVCDDLDEGRRYYRDGWI